MILRQVFMDAFIEIVISIAGNVVYELQNTEACIGSWLGTFTKVEELDMRFEKGL